MRQKSSTLDDFEDQYVLLWLNGMSYFKNCGR